MLNTIAQLAKIIGIVVTIAALFFTWREYQDRYEQSKVNRSFQFYDSFRSGELLKARARLHSRINELSARKDSSGNPLSNKKLVEVMIDTLTKNQDLIDYDIVLEFFDAAYKCSQIGGCDRKTVINLLGYEAIHLLPPIFPVIQYRARRNVDHGIGLECIAAEYSDKFKKFAVRCNS